MYVTFARAQELGHGLDSTPNWIAALQNAAETQFEGAERAVIIRLADTLKQANPDAPITELIEPMQAIFGDASNNPELNQSTACLTASVAYYSSKFWTEVTIANTGAKFPSLGTIIHVVCADIVGAIGGAGTGAAIGGAYGNPQAIINGAIIGGAAASGYTATEPKP